VPGGRAGDATRLDLMRTAGADKARVIVVAIDDIEQSVDCVKMILANFPKATIVARARNVQHYYELYELGVRMIERETLDSALMSARSALETLGWQPHHARTLAMRFRRHNVEQLRAMAPHRQNEALLIAEEARRRGLGVMVGNMVGTSLAMAPAFILGQFCDYVDLDGPTFLKEDRVPGVQYKDGEIWCPDEVWGSQAAVVAA